MTTTYVWLPVRCCCDGERILGFLKLRSGQANEGRTIITDQQHSAYDAILFTAPQLVTVKRWAITMRDFVSVGKRELAVYSEDKPVEYWREVPGFVEAMPGFDGR